MSALVKQSYEASECMLYEQVMQHGQGDLNNQFLAVIIASWLSGKGALPKNLGLSASDYRSLLSHQFPGFRINNSFRKDEVFDKERMPEKDDVLKLFNVYRANISISETWIAGIITAACLGSDHLWQDLGLWDRNQLSKLISNNFPKLAEKNNKNMKWKKFIYKQLCNEEGIYTCRSPSCEVCADYDVCFGPEQ